MMSPCPPGLYCPAMTVTTSPTSPSPCDCDDGHNVVNPHIPQPIAQAIGSLKYTVLFS